MKKQYVAYYRVSTQRQNTSHLGLEAQQKICGDFVKAKGGTIIIDFKDVESGKNTNRRGLWDAIEYCKANECALVIAKLDRLARNIEFTFKVMNTGIEIHFCDMPVVNTMILGVFATVAQYERELISARTKAALDAKRARGETWVRNLDTSAASKQSALNRRLTAQENESNQRVWRYLQSWESRNKRLTPNTSKEVFEELATILNELGYTTPRGLEFTGLRLRAMWTKLKGLYVYEK